VNARSREFAPPRRLGLLFQGGLIALCASAGLWNIYILGQSEVGPFFARNLLLSLVPFLPLPILIYRFRALQNASYVIERDGIRLRWGFRVVDIPMYCIDWVHPQEDLDVPLPKPWLRWPGAVLGSPLRRLGGIHPLEFMAAHGKGLVLIGTPERVYVISPADPEAFLVAYQRLFELGSLAPIEAQSLYPSVLAADLWQVRPVRYLLIGSALLSLILLVAVSLIIPGQSQVFLGSAALGADLDPIPAVALLLLPVLNSMFVLLDWGAGLFFYRREPYRPLAFLLWGSSVLLPMMFFVSLVFILGQS
jgi:hypothetical protein